MTDAPGPDVVAWRDGVVRRSDRAIAHEAAVAIVHDGSTTAVLMATPSDLEDLAAGFSLTEGVVEDLAMIRSIEVVESDAGMEARVWLSQAPSTRLAARRRRMAGPTGCGLCGIDSLAEAVRPPRLVAAGSPVTARQLLDAMSAMSANQPLGARTRATHAAGFWRPGGLVTVREDVGRHNALDKLIGALASRQVGADGVVLLTSRVSVEMVQKVAAFGAPIICAVSAPTSLAVAVAKTAGITLAAVCRADGFEVFTHHHRIDLV